MVGRVEGEVDDRRPGAGHPRERPVGHVARHHLDVVSDLGPAAPVHDPDRPARPGQFVGDRQADRPGPEDDVQLVPVRHLT